MAENTKIEWAHHTFNPWIGCTKVGPGCDHCYAADLAQARMGVSWGYGEARRHTAASTWKQPRAWNRRAAKLGIRYRVFCASLADVFDKEVNAEWRAELFELIRETPNLDWLFVTKRIGNARNMIEAAGGLPDNVWIGITVVNQTEADRDIPKLRALRLLYQFPVAFLSVEPMLGPLDISLLAYHECPNWLDDDGYPPMIQPDCGAQECCRACDYSGISDELAINWVICGGESGSAARPMHPDWARDLRDQCSAAGIPFLFKQWGEWVTEVQSPIDAVMPKTGSHLFWGDDQPGAWKLGKKAAGRCLDGQLHDGVPT